MICVYRWLLAHKELDEGVLRRPACKAGLRSTP